MANTSPCTTEKVDWSPAQVVLDDTDTRVRFSGNWSVHRGDGIGPNSWGLSYANTSHRTELSESPSAVTLTFTGIVWVHIPYIYH
jgi:hypothetical protein